MAITDKEQGVWDVDQVYNKINQGGIWTYTGSEKDLFGWGENFNGQLGINDTVTRSSPIQIPGSGFNLKSAQAYYDNSNAAITKTDGSLWVWGTNTNGSLGDNTTTTRSAPIQLGTDTTWAFVFTTYQNTYATKTDGTLWGWGGCGDGQLGLNASGDSERKSSPTQIGTGTDWSTADNCISGNRGGVAALKADGTLYTWGGNPGGQLGHNNKTNYSSPKQVPGTTWRSLGCGYNLTWATKTNGALWGWGEGFFGTLGLNEGGPSAMTSSPKQVGTDTTWNTVISSAYYGHTVATKTDGTLWTWGQNYGRGALGQNVGGPSTTGNLSSPTQVGTDTDWANSVAAGRFSAVAIKTDGSLYSWGAGYYGMSGRNSTAMASSPTQLPGTWSQVSLTAGANSGYFADKTYS